MSKQLFQSPPFAPKDFGRKCLRNAYLCLFVTLLFATTALRAYGGELVGYWNFDEGIGSVATDLSGNNNTGMLTNGPLWTAGKLKGGLSFDGIDDYVEIDHSASLDITRELTVSAWVYNQAEYEPLLPESEYHIIATKGWAPDPGGSWTLGWDKKTNALFFCVRRYNNNDVRCASFDFGSLIRDWHLITAVFNNNGKIRLYVDGALAAGPVNLGTQGMNSNTEPVYLGSLPSPSQIFTWHGHIDDVRIYNAALSDVAIASLYQDDSVTTQQRNFDFTIASSGNVATSQGSAVSTNINTVLTSGTPKSVWFSVSGLPANVTSSFSSSSCSPSCSTILTLQTNSSAPVGTYAIKVTGKAGGTTKTTSFNLSINQATIPTVSTPTITPDSGIFTDSVSVSVQDATSGASIYYTTDGSTPTQSSPPYTGALRLTKSTVMKAKAFRSGYAPSSEASASLTVTQPFDFSLSNSGNKSVTGGSSITNSISATLTSASSQPISLAASGLPSGATASFSSTSCSPSCSTVLTIATSGSTPAGNFSVNVTATGGGVTKTTAFTLGVSAAVVSTVATPTITPNGGSFTSSVSVIMATSTAGASIYYTTNGTTPTQSSTLYTGAMTLTSSAVVKAKAFKSGFNDSAEASASFSMSSVTGGSNLVAYWKFDEGTGTTAADSSGNGNTGTLANGPVWTSGIAGNALYFDGTDDNVTVTDSNSLDLTNSFTLSAWVNPASAFTDFRSILAKNYKYYLYASSTGFCGDGSTLGGFYEVMDIVVCQPSSLPVNTWTHLTLTYNSSVLTLYRNGGAVVTANVSGTLSHSTGTLQIGASEYGEYFQGLIDEVRVYNRALTNTEIQTIYQQAAVTLPFDYSISNSGDRSVNAGSSITNSINATLVSGATQAVSFSVSGLPSGATGTFSSASCTPVCLTVLTISTSGSTPAGSYPITVTSAGGGLKRSTIFTLSVSFALTVATPTLTPNGASFSSSVSVAMQSATSGSSIYYTTDGSTPTQSSTLYTGAMTLTSSATIKAAAFKSGYNPSTVSAASFTNSGTVTGNVYYVAKTGADTNTCTQAESQSTPKLTVGAGIACLSSGDTLLIKAGTYAETATTPPSGTSWSNPTTIARFQSDVVVFDTPNPLKTFNTSLQYLIIDGIIFDGINGNSDVVAIGQGPTHLRFKNCEIKNGYHNGIITSDPSIISPTDTYIELINCKVHDNGRQPIAEYSAGHNGAYISSGQNLIDGGEYYNNLRGGVRFFTSEATKGNNNIVRNALIHDNGWNAPSGPGIYLSDNNQLAYNNVIYHNNDAGIVIGITKPSDNIRIYNNTIYNNNYYGIDIRGTATNNIIKNNIIYANTATINDQGVGSIISNNLTVNPSFIDAGGGDFRVQSGSAAIDAGTDLSPIVMYDFNGISRPQGGSYDLGAFEKVAP